MYHSISTGPSQPFFRPFVVPPEQFAEQMAYLHDNGYTTLGATQFIEARQNDRLPDRFVVITFDDGFADFYDNALPVLKRYNQTATLYITTKYVGSTSVWMKFEENRPMLSWSQIKELQDAGIEIGAHTHTHPPQLDVMPLERAVGEIRQSKELLEEHLGTPIPSFAYPHGCHNPRLCREVEQMGFTSACAVKYALSTPTDNPFALARIIIRPDHDMQKFADSVAGKGWPIASPRERWQTKGYRIYRWWKYRYQSVTKAASRR